jgi:hypothetical protein
VGHVLATRTPAPRAVMLGNPPVAVAPHQNPCHAVRVGFVAIGEIHVARGNRHIRIDLPDLRHRIGFHPHIRPAPTEIRADGRAPILQFIDRPEQHGILGVKRHVLVQVMGVERRNPLSVKAFDGGRGAHGIPLTGIIIRT